MTESIKKRLSFLFFVFLGLGILPLTWYGVRLGPSGFSMLLAFMWYLWVPIAALVVLGTLSVTVFSMRSRERDWSLRIWSALTLLALVYLLLRLARMFGFLREMPSLVQLVANSDISVPAVFLSYATISILVGLMGLIINRKHLRFAVFSVVLTSTVVSFLLYDSQQGKFAFPKWTTAESLMLLPAAKTGDQERIRQLLEAGAELSTKDEHGWDALLHASDQGHESTVDFLLRKGADPNTKENRNGRRCATPECSLEVVLDGASVLMRAASKGQVAIVKTLLEHGANPYAVDNGGADAMIRAALAGRLEVMQVLLDHGIDPNLAGKEYRTSALAIAARSGHIEMVNLLLVRGADPRYEDANRGTPLHSATAKLRKEVVEELIAAGADPDPRNYWGITPLMLGLGRSSRQVHAEIEQTRMEIIEILIDAGADVNAADGPNKIPSKETPIMMAAKNGHARAISLLLDAGAHVDAQNSADRTALILASSMGHEEVVRLLLAAGANKEIVDITNKTALDWAERRNHESVVLLLTESFLE